MGKPGFGLMRLPGNGEPIDLEQVKREAPEKAAVAPGHAQPAAIS